MTLPTATTTRTTARIPYTRAWLAIAQRVVGAGYDSMFDEMGNLLCRVWVADDEGYGFPEHFWNDDEGSHAGLPAPMRPAEPRTREDDGLTECPACHGRADYAHREDWRWDCETCAGTGRCSVVDAIAWELDGDHNSIVVMGVRPAGYRHVANGVWLHESQAADYLPTHGLTTRELARRLAPIWHRVSDATMEPQHVEHAPVDDGERNERQTQWNRGGSHWRDWPRYDGAEGVAEIMRANDVSDELSRRHAADQCVLSSGRVVTRAFLVG